MAHLAGRCVGVCCLATSRSVPRARGREDQKIRPAGIGPHRPMATGIFHRASSPSHLTPHPGTQKGKR